MIISSRCAVTSVYFGAVFVFCCFVVAAYIYVKCGDVDMFGAFVL